MLFRFYLQVIISLICILGVFAWGDKATALLALFALIPVIMRIKKIKKLDEREQQLFYKIGNITLGVSILIIVLIYKLSDFVLYNIKIGDYWMILTILSLIFIQGLVGLIVFKIQ